jgi:hypothetical protein
MGICQFVVGGVLGSYGTYVPEGVGGNLSVVVKVSGAPSHVVIAFSYLLIIVYALTLAPVAWVYAAEVWSLETRATGMALAAVANWLFNFALGLFVPPAFHNISWKTFIIFGFSASVQLSKPTSHIRDCSKVTREIEFLFSRPVPTHGTLGQETRSWMQRSKMSGKGE